MDFSALRTLFNFTAIGIKYGKAAVKSLPVRHHRGFFVFFFFFIFL